MSINKISGAKDILSEFLSNTQESQRNETAVSDDPYTVPISLPQEDKVEFSPSALSRSRNMMAQNFVGGSTRDTKYLDAQLAGAASVQNLQNTMNMAMMSSLGAGGASIEAGGGSVEADLEEAMFYASDPQLANAKLLKDTTDAHRELFAEQSAEIEAKAEEAVASKPDEVATSEDAKDLVERIEAKAEEAMAPKDENGDPIEQPRQDKQTLKASSDVQPDKGIQDSADTTPKAIKEDAAEKAAEEIKSLKITI